MRLLSYAEAAEGMPSGSLCCCACGEAFQDEPGGAHGMVFDFKAFLGFCKRCELLLEKRLLLRRNGGL